MDQGRTPPTKKVCVYCDREFAGRKNAQVCGQICRQRVAYERTAKFQSAVNTRQEGRRCQSCNVPIEGLRLGRKKYCGETCRSRGTRRRNDPLAGSRRARAARVALRRAARGTRPEARVWMAGRCASCGDQFVGPWSPVANYCSTRCKRRESGARRRAYEAGVKITPGRRIAVYERDDWTCQICGDPVNRNAKVPELDAPVIDHRLALANGGEHGPDNWQTAHFYCNSVKRDLLEVA